MTEAYRQGFMKKCAENGVDPAIFTKAAQSGRSAAADPMGNTLDEISYLNSRSIALSRLKPKIRKEVQWLESAPPGATGYMSQNLVKEYNDFTNRYGYVDPKALAKSAQAMSALSFLRRPFARYWELLRGTGRATRGYRNLAGRLDRVLQEAIARQDPAAVTRIRNLRGKLDVAAHNYNKVLEQPFWNELSEVGAAPEGSMFSNGLRRAGNGGYRFSKKVTGELDKVMAARLGTGGAALGAGYLAFGPRNYDEEYLT